MSALEAARNIPLEEMDKQSLFHPYTSIAQHMKDGPVVIADGKGARLTDIHGKTYIDTMAGLWCVNIGYGRDEMVDAIAAQMRNLAYQHIFASMSHEPCIRLADALLQVLPDHMSKVFFCNSGSEANDTQVKIVWYYNNLRGKPEKRKIIGRQRGYHGITVAAGSMTGLLPNHKFFNLPLDGFLHTRAPHHYREAEPGESERDFSRRLAGELDEQIQQEGPETVAAFIAEPIMGAGGVVVPPEGYFAEIQPVLKKHDVLFIADEVICGFGRTGKMFGSETFDLEPDLISIAKGLTSAYLPMSAAVVSEKVWEVLEAGSPEAGPFAHGYTYSGHPAAAAAGLKNLEILQREDLVGNAAKIGAYLQKRLREAFADHPLVGEVRGLGMIAGVELVANKADGTPFDPSLQIGPRLAKLTMAEGLINRGIVNTLAFSPPLILTEADVDEIIAGTERALGTLGDQLTAEGHWQPA